MTAYATARSAPRLRALRADDAAPIAEMCARWELARMTSKLPHPYTIEHARAFLDRPSDRETAFAIEVDGALAGVVSWTRSEAAETEAALGYWIGAPFEGRGVATAAGRAAVDRAAEAGMARLTACVFQDNPGSARVLEKLGFSRVGPCVGASVARGGDAPTWNYALELSGDAPAEAER